MKYAEILLPQKIGPNLKTLTYELPEDSASTIGKLVEIPLRNKSTKGIIYRIHEKKPPYKTKKITKIVENAPHLQPWQIELMDWIAEHYFAPLFKALRLFLPATFVKKKSLKSPLPAENRPFELKFKHKLNKEQMLALKTIKNTKKTVSLLHGITGSGKTEVYLHVVENCMKMGKQVLILIPEIALTPQMKERFESHFHETTVTIHSQLTPKQKEQAWQSIHKGEAKIIIGSRSAIFAPFQNLDHIIIDEEHDSCYKQDQSPRYNTIHVAEKMAKLLGIKVLLGSATPSLESYYQAKQGHSELMELRQRPTGENIKLPDAKIVDLRDEFKKQNYSIFSEDLQNYVTKKLEKKEQTVLFLNRRGAASAVICRVCGHTEKCEACEIPFTYHKKITLEGGIYNTERLVCHHCGIIKKVPQTCPTCHSANIKFLGVGTQRIEEEVHKLYPQARVIRADRDTTQKRDQFKQMYEFFKRGDADILVGTQMIAMGLHFPKVNLVGIILADVGLTIPNFRSSEKTFQLITQVAGRAGREDQGQVIIQTYLPTHYAIKYASKHDYHGFYNQEIELREQLNQPPFSKMIKITIKDPQNEKALGKTTKIFHQLQTEDDKEHEINYYPALIPRLHKKYRWHVLINGPNPSKLLKKVKDLSGVTVDVDPLSSV